jgi:hypothetical protein
LFLTAIGLYVRGARAAQFHLHTLFYQPSDERSIGISSVDVTVRIISNVIQNDIRGVFVKNRNDVGRRIPVVQVAGQQANFSDEKGHITRKHRMPNINHNIRLFQFHGKVNVKFLIGLNVSAISCEDRKKSEEKTGRKQTL